MKNLFSFGVGLYSLSYYTMSKNNLSKCGDGEYQRTALCILKPDYSNTQGVVCFSQKSLDSPTLIKAKISGLKSNAKHGFHIHEFGDLSEGCKTAGAHYNPTGVTHGGPDDETRHFGDLGNLSSDQQGVAVYERSNDLISLIGKYSVIGRSCVVHEDEDDLGRGKFPDSKTTGHSGSRVACGVIALCANNKSI
jgi:Cu-Zn family superoxide dismutase